MAQFAVIGLGRFGSSASQELMRLGHIVLGVDKNPRIVDSLADSLTHSAILDVTNEQALKELSLISYDTVLLAIGELEASILCVLHLKNMGLKNIWVKASSRSHHEIVAKLGVARIIHPEEEMGVKVAQAINYPMVNQYMPIGRNIYIIEVIITTKISGNTIGSLLGNEYQLVKTLLVRRHKDLITCPDKSFQLENRDSLIVSGALETLKPMAERLM